MSSVAIFTCITAGYDRLAPPHRAEPGLVYLCFTDGSVTVPAPWQAVDIAGSFDSPAAANRCVKMLCQSLPALAGIERSVYVDGSIRIVGDLGPLLEASALRPEPVLMYEHPFRDCAYAEALACARYGHDSLVRIARQTRSMSRAGFPARHGLFEAGVIVRRHEPDARRLMERWWTCYANGPRRDQITLPFAAWLEGVAIGSLGRSDPRYVNRHFKLAPHERKRANAAVALRSRVNRLALALFGARTLLRLP